MATKILHIFSTFAVGGPQRRFATLANSLAGYQHIIASGDGRGEAISLVGDNCQFEHAFSFKKSRIINRQNIAAVRALISKHQPDLLCTYNFGAMEAVIANRPFPGSRPRIPNIHFEDGFGPDETPDVQIHRRVMLRRWALGAAMIVVPSNVLMQVATSHWKIPSDRLLQIDNGINLDLFEKANMPTGTNFCIGTLGAIRKEKNLGRLLDVVQLVAAEKKVRLWIAGSGPELKELQDLVVARSMSDLVHFSGHTDTPEMIYPAFDLFVMTSDTEQMPISLLEAMATSLPVVATRVGDIDRMLAPENCRFMFDVDDIDGLVWGIKTLIEKPELREKLGSLNRAKVVRDYDRAGMLAKYDALFKGMATSSDIGGGS